jgi:hypothetical protein
VQERFGRIEQEKVGALNVKELKRDVRSSAGVVREIRTRLSSYHPWYEIVAACEKIFTLMTT